MIINLVETDDMLKRLHEERQLTEQMKKENTSQLSQTGLETNDPKPRLTKMERKRSQRRRA